MEKHQTRKLRKRNGDLKRKSNQVVPEDEWKAFPRTGQNHLCQGLHVGQVRQELKIEHLDLALWRSLATLSSRY